MVLQQMGLGRHQGLPPAGVCICGCAGGTPREGHRVGKCTHFLCREGLCFSRGLSSAQVAGEAWGSEGPMREEEAPVLCRAPCGCPDSRLCWDWQAWAPPSLLQSRGLEALSKGASALQAPWHHRPAKTLRLRAAPTRRRASWAPLGQQGLRRGLEAPPGAAQAPLPQRQWAQALKAALPPAHLPGLTLFPEGAVLLCAVRKEIAN